MHAFLIPKIFRNYARRILTGSLQLATIHLATVESCKGTEKSDYKWTLHLKTIAASPQ